MNDTIILTPDGPVAARSIESASGRLFVVPVHESSTDGWENPGAAKALAMIVRATPETSEERVAVAIAGEAILPVVEADAALEAEIAEAGRRNSAKDEGTLRQIVSLIQSLGVPLEIEAEDDEEPPDTGETEAKEAAYTVEGDAAQITFREGSIDADNLITLAEAAARFEDETRTVFISPIRPGWGNKRDNRYYPTSTLEVATREGKFNNLKMFADHPRKSDEKELPERSVKDWVATTREAEWDSVRQRPIVPLVVHDPAVYQRFKEAPEQIAFSVLGSGVAKPGEVGGKKGTIVESIAKLRSVDWVTEAGAGGALDFAEAASEEFDMNLAEITAEQVAALQESNPTLYKHLIGLAKAMPDVDKEERTASAVQKAIKAAVGSAEDEAPEGDGIVGAKESDVAEVPEWARPLVEASVKAAEETRIAEARAEAKGHVEEALKSSTLPRSAKAAIRAQFAESQGDIRESVASTVTLAESLFAKASAQPLVTGLGAAPEEGSLREAALREAESRLASRFGSSVTPPSTQLVFSAEQLGGVSAPTGTGAEAETARINEASQDVQDTIAAKFR